MPLQFYAFHQFVSQAKRLYISGFPIPPIITTRETSRLDQYFQELFSIGITQKAVQ
jgi:hypothetical protein